MSWDQTKASEGLFEALPQSMLQAYVVIYNLYYGYEVTTLQVSMSTNKKIYCQSLFAV